MSLKSSMSTSPTALVQKHWNYCNILRDDGLSYGDYVEQLTFLLFLKMADEQSRPPFNNVAEPSRLCAGEGHQRRDAAATVPKDCAWPSLLARDGDELETHLASQARHQLVASNHDVRFAHCGPACESQLST